MVSRKDWTYPVAELGPDLVSPGGHGPGPPPVGAPPK